jgi:hypothetical protein
MRVASLSPLLRPVRARLARRRWRAGRPLAASGELWATVGLLFVLVTVLGVVGFTRHLQLQADALPLTTRLYLSLQLFVLESGSVRGVVPWQLEVARFAAPVVAGYAILQTLVAVFRDEVAAVRLRFRRGHVVVAGLGGKGVLLTRALLGRGERVVVVEADDGNAHLDTIRAGGGLVVVGDARSPETQRRAGVTRARRLVVLTGPDVTNVEVVTTARQLSRERRSGVLRCVVHLVDPQLAMLLGTDELERYGPTEMRVEFVNVHAAAARALLRAHPPFASDGTPAVVLVGGGGTAQEVLLEMARAWGARRERDGRRLPVTLVGMAAGTLESLGARHPEIEQLLEVALSGDRLESSAVAGGAVAYVCPDDDAAAARATGELRRRLHPRPARIVVVLEHSGGLGSLLQGAPRPEGGPATFAFGLLGDACDPEVLLAGTTELLARALHRVYLDHHAAGPPVADAALRPWAELPAALRESNRDQAAHVSLKLAAVGRSIAPLTDWDAAHRAFSDEEVEVMARLEHDRWVAERRRGGWRPGPRDPERRTTPHLVDWDELSEEVREYDRIFVRGLPALLASVGLQASPGDAAGRAAVLTAPRAG